MARVSEENWNAAFEAVKSQFELLDLLTQQRKANRSLLLLRFLWFKYHYTVVFGSPECLLSTTVRRGIFKCQSFTEKLIGIAIDEVR